ncbi:MAG: Serine/threonine-protein kinase PknA [Myxococcales bacterium]|nr:Serine/threonine-protein kinase PknA [Myxococcales bacterium]
MGVSGAVDEGEGDARGRFTPRFEIVRRLGAGGMGVVYEAQDLERDTRVAIKTLLRLSRGEIVRLKQEFRALADLHHINLVRLGELFEDEGRWFFTMELVDGVDVMTWVCGPQVRPEEISTAPLPRSQLLEPLPPPVANFDEGRLRTSLQQVAHALSYLHDAGKVHRDIKPSNILVGAGARVVLLDFGVVADLSAPQPESAPIIGTEAFMAPEVLERRVGPEADWYSLGVLLYRMLSGRLPAAGPHEANERARQGLPLPSPRQLLPSVPPDLDALCMSLLSMDPTARPRGRAVLQKLGATGRVLVAVARPSTPATLFVGRRGELGTLASVFAGVVPGRATGVVVDGESGVGKSALIREFLRELDPEEALVLRGRCYERESVPYKALDEVIDRLGETLAALPEDERATLAPKDATLLGELFPTLAPLWPAGTGARPLDPHKLRRRAFGAVRELLQRLGERQPIIVAIDDLQWADADSLQLLRELLREPGAPRLMLLVSARATDGGANDVADELSRSLEAPLQRIALGRLEPADARALIERLAAGVTRRALDFDAIERAAEGHPLFLDVLVRHRVERGDAGPIRLEDALQARVHRLTPRARGLLDLLSESGGPLAQEVAAAAAGLDADAFADTVAELRAAHLCRTGGTRPADVIEPYHDRVRATVAHGLADSPRRILHRRLAEALERWPAADAEAIAQHWRDACEPRRAQRYYIEAADAASRSLAYDRAARLYQMALELAPDDAAAAHPLRLRLGEALANAGRGADAAGVYLRAAADARADEAIELKRLAADQFLRSGRVDQGLATLRAAFAAVGLKLAPSPRRALLSLVLRRAQVRLRGERFKERSLDELSPREVTRMDLCWSTAIGLGMVDNVHGTSFQSLNLLLALRAGDPYRIARALAYEACFSGNTGVATARRTARLVEAAEAIAAKLGDPHSLAWAASARATTSLLEGRWRDAGPHLAVAEERLRDLPGAAWERDTIARLTVTTLAMRGRFRDLQERVPQWLRDAGERGDLFATTNLRTGLANLVWLAADDPAGARRATADAMADWSQQGFYMQHYFELVGLAQIDLYEGNGRAARTRVLASWGPLTRSMLTRVQFIHCQMLHLRARTAIAAAVDGSARQRRVLLEDARNDARLLRKERVGYAFGWADLIDAAAAHLEGRHKVAADRLATAERAFEAADMRLYAATARRARGFEADADATFTDEQVRNPARMAAMLAPGFWFQSRDGK